MATCRDCFHCNPCHEMWLIAVSQEDDFFERNNAETCEDFVNGADVVEAVRCKDYKYGDVNIISKAKDGRIMTKYELQQLPKLKNEAKFISDRIKQMENALKEGKADILGLPLSGLSEENIRKYENKLVELKEQYSIKLKECFDTIDRLNEFIESIPDEELRIIFSLKYITNMSWDDITWYLGYTGDGSTARKKQDRYLAEINNKSVEGGV